LCYLLFLICYYKPLIFICNFLYNECIVILVKQKSVLQSLIVAAMVAVALCLLSVLPAMAADYNCGAYGASTYQNSVCGASTGTGNGGSLENTGQQIWPIAVAVLMILLGTILLFRTRRKMKARAAPQQSGQ